MFNSKKDPLPVLYYTRNVLVIMFKLYTDGHYEDCIKIFEKSGIFFISVSKFTGIFEHTIDLYIASLYKIVISWKLFIILSYLNNFYFWTSKNSKESAEKLKRFLKSGFEKIKTSSNFDYHLKRSKGPQCIYPTLMAARQVKCYLHLISFYQFKKQI